jgi:response regulator of citrate/malate metabolism
MCPAFDTPLREGNECLMCHSIRQARADERSKVKAAEPTQSQQNAREVAIQCVAEMWVGLRILETEVTAGAAARDVHQTLTSLRRVIQLLTDATYRDGRPR